MLKLNSERKDKNKISDLRKKHYVKFLTRKIGLSLINANPGSPLTSAYWHTVHCIDDATVINGKFQTHNYCKNRFCPVCSRIRSAKIINGYSEQLAKIPELTFLTLTIPNCSAFELPIQIKEILVAFRKIVNNYKRRNNDVDISGVRKIECTYNEKENTYHPHLHILTGRGSAEILLSEWLKKFGSAVEWAQKIKSADPNTIKELAKYFSKLFSKDENGKLKMIPPKALNEINIAFKGVRTFQSFGNIRMVKEDFEEKDLHDGIECNLSDGDFIYTPEFFTWICEETGEMAENIEPNEYMKSAEQIAERLTSSGFEVETDFINTDNAIRDILRARSNG